MNVYDFDGTIYGGDSSVDFYLFCLKRHPKIAAIIPKFLVGLFAYKRKKIDKTKLKELFFLFLRDIPDAPREVKLFWDKNQKKIQRWYLNSKKPDDVIASASPEFLLKEICARLSVSRLVASDVDVRTGKFNKLNCRGEEKARRFCETFGNEKIENFYSDSKSDAPMAKRAARAFLIKRGKTLAWKL